MRRYFVWSLAFHVVLLLVGAMIAPLRGFSGSSRPATVISVGLVDFADPGKVKGGRTAPAEVKAVRPTPPIPKPAADELIAKNPAVNEELAEPKAPEKTKKTEKKAENPDTKKVADKPSQKDTAKTTPAQLAVNDTGGVTGSLTEGDGGADIWGVETGANVNPYHRRGFAAIRGNWRNPAIGPQGRLCVVMFRVKRNGQITDIEVEKESGSDLFDRAALRAVQVTAAWPAFPNHWEEDEQIIHLEFQYRP